MDVCVLDSDQAVRRAGKELRRCLRRMTGAEVRLRRERRHAPEAEAVFVGLSRHFRGALSEEVCDPHRWDDELAVRSAGNGLVLTGSNARSVLFAAYRWLEALGARWVRPGRDGEHLPRIAAPALSGWDIHEKAGNRHRGIVIEGSCSIEQVLAVVDWMPKLRMNAYMLQFWTSAQFWRRWYGREDLKAVADPHPLSMEECAALDSRVVEAVQERGLLLHRVGHGWTCGAVGVEGGGWERAGPAPEEIRPLLAEVNGVRDWFEGVPLNTELCYSNPEARRRLVDAVVSYAVGHPEVDVLHVWASDGTNNWCECAECAPMEPSDWYVTLLNEISPRLAALAPQTRVVALCYSNTMWPPERVPPSGLGANLIFMFAPIARCYGHSILDPECSVEPPATPYRRNQVRSPRANGDYGAMLRAWQRYLPRGTDAFVFDYHLWVPFPRDLVASDFVRVMHDDVQQYEEAGLHGWLSCQIHRTSMPTALPQVALARYLWDGEVGVEEVTESYLTAAFGPAAGATGDFLAAFTRATGAGVHGNRWWEQITAAKAREVGRVLREHAPRLRQARKESPDPVRRLSLRLLYYFVRYQQLVWSALAARARGRSDARARMEKVIDFLARTESQVYRWVDTPYWVGSLRDEVLPAWEQEEAAQAQASGEGS